MGADRCPPRRLVQRRRLRVDLLPEPNNSVRVPDGFMQAALGNGRCRRGSSRASAHRPKRSRPRRCCARSPRPRACAATRGCSSTPPSTRGTRARTARASTPLTGAPRMFLDDSACNLASLNLMAFGTDDDPGLFDVDDFCHAVRTMITAQEIIVVRASYPTEAIECNSHDTRPLGLGYANPGGAVLAGGTGHDSEKARAAATTTALRTTTTSGVGRIAEHRRRARALYIEGDPGTGCRGPGGLRLRVQARGRFADHPRPRAPEGDRRDAAVHLGSDIEDDQRPKRRDRRPH